MTKFAVNEEVTALWGAKKKEYIVKIVKINDDGKTVKILWNEKSKNGNILVSSKFLISNLKKIGEEEETNISLDLFVDPDNPVDPDADY